MHSFQELSSLFETQFNKRHFPKEPAHLYDAAQHILQIPGKRVRPVAVLMGNELFEEILPDAYQVANAVELFHNFSLIHDDIMDKAPLRRGIPTVHINFGENAALLSGDVMLVRAYEYLAQIKTTYLPAVLNLFNKTAKEVCEGQQLDMDFEKRPSVSLEEYVGMITLKTSVLLAASLQLGAILGGARGNNQQHLYEFGKKLGIAFQVQDDFLDCFGDPQKFGKQVGGDILANKKTFLMIRTFEVANAEQKEQLNFLLENSHPNKVEKVLQLYKACGADLWAQQLKEKYYTEALHHLEEVAVISNRKEALKNLALYLMQREH
ncbi:MAG TPA: polyprenyl synthetase family protein [Ferruginibacter sp.]|nr:polyprenyl synthetase family protein [Ferruginibacter sp.]HRE62195.1 polyprenyl synthetase family protein [Ferruginibacter sp.]